MPEENRLTDNLSPETYARQRLESSPLHLLRKELLTKGADTTTRNTESSESSRSN